MNNSLIFLLFTILLISGCESEPTIDEKGADLGVVEDLTAMYHGLPLNDQGKVLNIDAAYMLHSFEAIISTYGASAYNDSIAGLAQLYKLLEEEGRLPTELALVLKGVQAQLATDASKQPALRNLTLSMQYLRELSKALPVKNSQRYNKEAIIQLSIVAELNGISINPEIFAIIQDWTIWFPIVLPYCILNGVPQPPDWGTAGWVRKTNGMVNTVPANRLYILNSAGYTTQVWTATDPAGTGGCIALPRNDGTDITLGVICQNKDTGKACFWDNRPHSGGNKYSNTEMVGSKKSIVNDWVNGKDAALIGGGKCINCHRGENAFVLHQDTLISNNPPMPFDTDSAVWYTMINSLGWINLPKTTLPGNAGCVTCHEIGSTTDAEKANYCALLKQASNKEMPSVANPATWNPANGTAEKTHIDIMKANGC